MFDNSSSKTPLTLAFPKEGSTFNESQRLNQIASLSDTRVYG